MKPFFRALFLMIAFSFAVQIARAKDGGSCGGGGTIIKSPQNKTPFITDRLTADSHDLLNQLNPDALILANYKTGNPEAIAVKVLDKWLEAYKRSPNQRFGERVLSSAALVNWLIEIIKAKKVISIPDYFAVIPRYTVPANLKNFDESWVQTAIYFHPLFGPIVSAPVWSGLLLPTKVALIIHEALRQIQMTYMYDHNNSLFSDYSLQIITKTIVEQSPSENIDLAALVNPEAEKLRFVINIKGMDFCTQPNFCGSAVNDVLMAKMTLLLTDSVDDALLTNQNLKMENEIDFSDMIIQLRSEKIIK